MSLQQHMVPVIQGQCKVSDDPQTVFTTVLGSCIAVCLCDEEAQVGGMNHFLLPGEDDDQTVNLRYGVHAMELLINGMLRRGAEKSRLWAKVFGGSSIAGRHRDIGEKNQAFIQSFLQKEQIPCVAFHMGGTSVRKIRFEPTSGRVRHILLPDEDLQKTNARLSIPIVSSSDVELF